MKISSWEVRALLLVPMLVACVAADCQTMPGMSGNGNGNGNGTDSAVATLFVVNNQTGITSYGNPANDNGDVAPATDLPAGAATQVFQPRGIVVTRDGVLILTRQNGGLAVFNDASTATGNTPADRIVEGNATHLGDPISLAYDANTDTLYVGNIDSAQGILAFNNVSNVAFDGNIAPDRMFNPADRAPSQNESMTLDAMWFDGNGTLYVSDTSGLNVNSSRILTFENASAADGETQPNRTLTGPWAGIEDLVIDGSDNLLVVDGSDAIFIFNSAAGLDGGVTADSTIMVNGQGVDLEGIVSDSDGTAFVSDRGNHEIIILPGIAAMNGAISPSAQISGNTTELFSPRQLWLVEP